MDDDLWCQHEDALAIGRSALGVNGEMLVRLLFGMPADVGWRMSSGREDGPELERVPSTGARLLGILAIVGVVGWGIAICGYLAWGGEGAWATAGALMYIAQVGGGFAFAGAAIGIALRFQDQLSVVGAIAGAIGGLMALFGAMGAYQLTLLLPVGTGVMAWDLGRARLLPRSLAIAHSVSGLLTVPLLIGLVAGWNTPLMTVGFLALIIPYLGSWLGIGVWLIRGLPAGRETDAAPHRMF